MWLLNGSPRKGSLADLVLNKNGGSFAWYREKKWLWDTTDVFSILWPWNNQFKFKLLNWSVPPFLHLWNVGNYNYPTLESTSETFSLVYCTHGASLVAIKNPPAMQEPREMWIQSLSREDPLEKRMATHSSTLAWRIPWTEEPGGLQSTGPQRVGHDWRELACTHSVPIAGDRLMSKTPALLSRNRHEKSILSRGWEISKGKTSDMPALQTNPSISITGY